MGGSFQIKAMPNPPSSPIRPFLLPLLCVLLSGALWAWLRQIPAEDWELTGTATPPATIALAAASPEALPKASPKPKAAPKAPASSPSPKASPKGTPQASPSPAPASPSPSQEAKETPQPTPTPSPTPTETELLGPLPTHTQEEIAARAAATPFEVPDVAKDPQLWPKQVVLIMPVRFSVIKNGVIAGNFQMPQGRSVLLRQVYPDGTVLLELPEIPGTQAKVKAQATDLLARARALAEARQKPQAQ